ncbi:MULTISPECIES: carbohydrate ABC transporter permease [Coprococcus]|uniref:Carbohydrate ABC transporter permease n=1 Tax=Coprococcus comes TaxID=410072 RepID=A0A3R5XL06_9FIRM|nr:MULTISPECIES: carbohydrate ABC transporter permease [Coprococcus]NSF17660.1 carbohydrate ABC transporter permease [Coprococcus comes]RGU42914.1 carbohydrate ABC transporter permease [Coprococcus comes]
MVKKKGHKFFAYLGVILVAILVILPFLWMVVSAFKSQRELFAYPPTFFPKVWKVENFIEAASRGSISFWQMFLNTMKIALPSTIFNIIFSSLAGYAFARLKFPFRDTIFMCFIAAMMVPFAITLIPRFLMFKDFGFYDTYVPLIVPVMFGTPFSIFLTRQFFMTLPKELEEAAIMDGCSHFRIWAQIFMPLCKPIIATLSVFQFQSSYNDFMGPVIYIASDAKFTVQMGLSSFRNSFTSRYDLIMAGSILALIPVMILFVCCQKYIVRGIAMSGMKG